MVKKNDCLLSLNGRKIKVKVLKDRGFFKINRDLLASVYKGPDNFDFLFINYKDVFTNLVENFLRKDKRNLEKLDKDIYVASEKDSKVKQFFNNLVEIVDSSFSRKVPLNLKKEYKKNAKNILKRVSVLRKRYDEDVVLVPLRGGAYIVDLFQIDKKNVVAIDCKRIPMKQKGNFCLGMRKGWLLSDVWEKKFSFDDFHKKHVRIVEACVVSGMTTVGFLTLFLCLGIKPKLIEINTLAMSQQGIKVVKNVAKEYNFNVKFFTGEIFYRLGNFYQSTVDELLTAEGKLVLGDVKDYLDF